MVLRNLFAKRGIVIRLVLKYLNKSNAEIVLVSVL